MERSPAEHELLRRQLGLTEEQYVQWQARRAAAAAAALMANSNKHN